MQKTTPTPPRDSLAPLYAAGFITAFGAHSVAAGLGFETGELGSGLFTFGILLALYDIAEIILKPVFGALSDRIGSKPVIVGGLALFAVASLFGAFAVTPVLLGITRLGQGGAAAAFSPASSAAVARIAGKRHAGTYFGKYGSWKGLGYTLGPLIGAGLILLGGYPALFITLAMLSAGTALWVSFWVKPLPVLPRPRYTLADLFRQTTNRGFLLPTLALSAATAALGVAVGFLPLLAVTLHLTLFASMAAVTLLAITSTITQPLIGRLRDQGHISTGPAIGAGLLLISIGLATAAVLPAPETVYVSAVLLGLGIGAVTPLGFAHLAATTPDQRMGRTLGTAEIGRGIGDAGGPLLVGSIAAAASLTAGLGTLAILTAVIGAVSAILLNTHQQTQQRPDGRAVRRFKKD